MPDLSMFRTFNKNWVKNYSPGSLSPVIVSTREVLYRAMPMIPFYSSVDSNEACSNAAEWGDWIVENGSLGKKILDVNVDDLSCEERLFMMDCCGIRSRGDDYSRNMRILTRLSARCMVVLNDRTHWKFESDSPGLSLKQNYAMIDRLERLAGEKYQFCFDEQLGYLSALPRICGTGLKVFILLHLSALDVNGELNKLYRALTALGFLLFPLGWKKNSGENGLWWLSNRFTLGVTEEEILRRMAEKVILLENFELQARRQLLETDYKGMANKIFRSFGALQHSFVIPIEEFRELYANCRLGVALGMFAGLPDDYFEKLYFFAAPGALQLFYGAGKDNMDIRRAEICRKYTAGF